MHATTEAQTVAAPAAKAARAGWLARHRHQVGDAVTVVVLILIVGIMLVIALLTIPAAIARQHTRSLPGMMLLSTALGAALTIGGIWLSYTLNLASGATVILLSGAAFALSAALAAVRGGVPRPHAG